MPETLPPADWFADPTQRHEQRYWDGAAWTEHVFTSGVQGVDPLEEAPASADGHAVPEAAEESSEPADEDTTDAARADGAPAPEADDEPPASVTSAEAVPATASSDPTASEGPAEGASAPEPVVDDRAGWFMLAPPTGAGAPAPAPAPTESAPPESEEATASEDGDTEAESGTGVESDEAGDEQPGPDGDVAPTAGFDGASLWGSPPDDAPGADEAPETGTVDVGDDNAAGPTATTTEPGQDTPAGVDEGTDDVPDSDADGVEEPGLSSDDDGDAPDQTATSTEPGQAAPGGTDDVPDADVATSAAVAAAAEDGGTAAQDAGADDGIVVDPVDQPLADEAVEDQPSAQPETETTTGVASDPAPLPPWVSQPAPAVPAASTSAGGGLRGALVDGSFAEHVGDDPATLQNIRLLRCHLTGGELLARQGTMVAYQGQMDFSYEGAGGIGRALKRAATGEGVRMMRVKGSGDVFLADEGKHVFLLHLDGGAGLSVNGRSILAFSDSLSWSIERVQGATLLSGGLFNTTLRGTGWCALVTDGDPVVLRPQEAPTYADVNALVAWSADLSTKVVTSVKAGAIAGFGSGEAVQMRFDGTGIVVVQPSEGRPVAGQG